MNIQEIRQAKLDMERKIQYAVHEAVTVFHKQTSLSPCDIYIRLLDVGNIDEANRYVVGSVTATVNVGDPRE